MIIQSPRLLADLAMNSLRLPGAGRPDPLALLSAADGKPGTFARELAATALQAPLPDMPEPSGRSAYRIAGTTPAIVTRQPQPPSDSDWMISLPEDDAEPAVPSHFLPMRHAEDPESNGLREPSTAPDSAAQTAAQSPPLHQAFALPVPLPPRRLRTHEPMGFGQFLAGLSSGLPGLTRGPLGWIAISAALIALAMVIL